MLRMCGYKNCEDVEGPVEDDDGNPIFWVKKGKTDVMNPLWGATFAVNFAAPDTWVEDINNMPSETAPYLEKVSRQEFLDAMATGVFETMNRIWKQKSEGTRDAQKERHTYMTRLNNRRKAVSTIKHTMISAYRSTVGQAQERRKKRYNTRGREV
jgi:hypothetical protein